jgi:hypothetical protein
MGDVVGATVLMPPDIRYFQPSEAPHAWPCVKTSRFAEDVPVRTLLPSGHVMSGYTPEYDQLLTSRVA